MKRYYLLILCLCSATLCSATSAQNTHKDSIYKDGFQNLSRFGRVVDLYRAKNGGFANSQKSYFADMASDLKYYGFENIDDLINAFKNPYLDSLPNTQENDRKTMKVIPVYTRPDGTLMDGPKNKSLLDVYAYISSYVTREITYENQLALANYWGEYVVLRENKRVEVVPCDEVVHSVRGTYFIDSFPKQPGVPFMSISQTEFLINNLKIQWLTYKPQSSTGLVVDNNGPESLVQFSRRLSQPNVYGIEREELWKTFDPAQPEFTLADIQAGATKLGLETQVQKLSLAQLQMSASPALLFLKDDGRIITLTGLDDDRAVVVDRGLTRNIDRSVLEARYSGEALVPTKAVTQNSGIVAEDALRLVSLPSLDAEVPEQVTLRNTGTKAITLQLEYPLLGVTESKLSKDTLAPGETATLDLKVKWRSVLKAPTQNVLVSLQTNDPITPRVQLAFLLNPPLAAATR